MGLWILFLNLASLIREYGYIVTNVQYRTKEEQFKDMKSHGRNVQESKMELLQSKYSIKSNDSFF
jgi:hypothetical protein